MIANLINEVAISRNAFIAAIENISEVQATMKLPTAGWNITDITEHLFWAEQGAIYGMWKILYDIREGKVERSFESCHKDWSIEKLIEQTWKEKEIVPAMAAPRLAGTLIFWRFSLANLQPLLEAFGKDLKQEELRLLAHPHPISGPMDFQQRLEFLSFHIKRHRHQVQIIIDSFK